MTSGLTKAFATVAAVVALVSWVGGRPAQATDWPGRYDVDGGRYYAEEDRDHARLGLDTGGSYRAYYTGGVYFPTSPPAVYVPNYRYAAERSDGYYAENMEPARDNVARVRLVLPAGAQVWFDDKATQKTGSVRDFESPRLTPGKEYSYHVTARWTDNGKEITRTRLVGVRAGSSVTVDLTQS
jgi:uncharacterized protein (TIGR03000 family)